MALPKPTGRPAKAWLFFVFCLLAKSGLAQLTVAFEADKEGACAPAIFGFANNTTGASATARYQWELGNGNTSALINPEATYTQPGTYTIKLTVTDGNQTSSATRTITIYQNPTVNFTAAAPKICLPEPANFTATINPGSGTVQELFWDFGDGNSQTVFGQTTVTHTYTEPQLATVALSVSNSFGCHSAVVKKDIIRVLPPITIQVDPDKIFVCSRNDQVNFTHTSTGPGTLSYRWNFGDNNSSSLKNPGHTYQQAGSYQVSLTVTSSEGCSKTTDPLTINVDNFVTSFSNPTLMCEDEFQTFLNTSTPRPEITEWTIGNNPPETSINGFPISRFFTDSGVVAVRMKNTFGTCVQTITRNITIQPRPVVEGFILETAGRCGAPDSIRLHDTTATAVRWEWRSDFGFNTFSTQQRTSFFAQANRNYPFSLTVTNVQGCTQMAFKSITLLGPSARILLKSSSSPNGNQSCGPVTATFVAEGSDSIATHSWSFSNSTTTTTQREPTQTFTTEGSHVVTLNYRLVNGCTGTATYIITVYGQPRANFDVVGGNRTLCGPMQANMQNLTTGATSSFAWNTDYDNNPGNFSSGPTWVYRRDGTYSVALIAINGTCRDTMIRRDFFTVRPPFPEITQVQNTCEGTRGLVTFTHQTLKGVSGTWNFGDGTTAPFNPAEPTISHTFTRTGTFNVTLTVANDNCVVTTARNAYVLLKQNPRFTLGAAEVCGGENFNYNITNIEANPFPHFSSNHYYFIKWEEGRNGATFDGSYNFPWNTYWVTNIAGTANSNNFRPRELRAIFQSSGFNCADTTNFVSLAFRGAQAGFEIVKDSICWQQPAVFRDTSRANGSSNIVSRRWLFGDGATITTAQGGLVSHQYQNPGLYTVSLEVTDAAGCRVRTNSSRNVYISGPKAAFSMGAETVPLNQTVYFSNQTQQGFIGSTNYSWDFGDGNTSTDMFPINTYPTAGTYKIRLVATNTITGCRDTAERTLTVRPFNTAFQLGTRFVHSSNCPPVLVTFNNTSFGGIRYEWDFGDGTGSVGFSPSHLYTQPGKYRVSLRVFGFNGLEGTFTDSVEISLPEATFVANPLTGCTSQQVSFLAKPSSVKAYNWDFGDGTISITNDSLANHRFLTPGVYRPRLLVTDSNGCTLPVAFANNITIDSLFLALPGLQRSLCDTATQLIQPEVRAVTGNSNADTYTYNWAVTYNGQSVSIAGRNLRYAFNRPGRYLLQLRVQTPTGCDKTLTDSVTVLQGTRALIAGPASGCVGSPLTFSGNTSTPLPGLSWRWLIGNQSFTQQNPPPVVFDTVATLSVQLIAISGQCADTARQQLTIHPRPVLQIANRNPVSCIGRGVTLQASGAATWQWQPAAGLSNAAVPNPLANPAENTLYRITGTSTQGCTTTDSVNVRVAKPFTIALSPASAEICAGEQVALQATGAAATWQWVSNTGGLSNTNTASPTARPSATTTYTVAGTDADQCFTDTARINIVVNNLPTVDAGPDIELVSGAAANLQLTTTGNIVRYSWTPARDLSCTACANPVATPTTPVRYVVSVTTDKNCTASDSLNVTISCGKTYYIPTGFTPNGDGLNDYFYVLGGGGNVKLIQVYNRWGDLVFERKNIAVNDRNNGWDGRIKGNQAPAATYIYTAIVECIDGTVYEYKGSVMLMR